MQVGGPSMRDLWTLCVGEPASDEAKPVLAKVNYGHVETERNIEDLLSRCDAYLQLFRDEAAVSDFRGRAIAAIVQRCSAVGGRAGHDLGPHKELLRRLARRRARDPRLRLFTTNYDTCFEQAAGELGLVALDGFSFSQPRRFDPLFFDYDIVRRSSSVTDAAQYVPGVFQYFKLHGSIDWELTSSGQVVVNAAVEPSRASIVYPTDQKYRYSFQQPHLELVAQFLACLRQHNSCLFVVGWGFNDDHLSEPIFSALEANPHLRVVVCSPNARAHYDGPKTSSWARIVLLSEQGADLAVIQASFADIVSVIPDIRALTPGERLERAIQGAVQAS